ncbi:phosphatase PAP2 family protein [Actinomadura sp. 9N407]|uniref:phosphatase PAP2 family protein n=1 Tax=Actinomadura sp. 9N407 TaxID=3375154 RepID=UPI0037A6D25C
MANEAIPMRPVLWMGRVRPLLTEAGLLLALFAVYKFGRQLVDGGVGAAMANAKAVWDTERAMALPDEIWIQDFVLSWEPAAFLANLYYVGVHFPATALLLVWLWVRHPAAYTRVRNELVVLTAAGMAVHMLYPLAPPRLAGLGMTDTMLSVGPSAYPAAADGFANQYAAMPSLHVGWALLVALAVLRVSPSPWRWVLALHAPVTVLVVVVTANHYWLDGMVAAALLGGTVLVVALARRRGPVPAEAVPVRLVPAEQPVEGPEVVSRERERVPA